MHSLLESCSYVARSQDDAYRTHDSEGPKPLPAVADEISNLVFKFDAFLRFYLPTLGSIQPSDC